ncbi:MAG: DsrE/DsrF/DrsH-like family protein [Proteobacteria bacterium]|nr:DsrE/DsrF/DrsH-like family protein [Pseudomonadota bacterium]MBU1716553.1 DsrE/DsrF/DrsH-like family protein [Pseudomonadota bacterium]
MQKKGTIMLLSGELDKALTAFIIATGFAALGVEMKMWFMIWGHNCLKKRRGLFSRRRKPDPAREGIYRDLATDNFLQPMVEILNRGGANHLPLSQLNLMGLGPKIFSQMLKKKNIPSLESLIKEADELGVKFNICQICCDALGLSVDDLIVPNVEVKGVSAYMKDTMDAQVNLFI